MRSERTKSRLISWNSVMKLSTRKSNRRKRKWVTVNDRMQKGYRYELSAPVGRCFDPEFKPELTPQQMLALGVFCGKYMTDTRKEFPISWFKHAKLSPAGRDCSLNYFRVNASAPLAEWRAKGWIYPDDPRGWFQYCHRTTSRKRPSRWRLIARRRPIWGRRGREVDGISWQSSLFKHERC
jgi:hypothetical protein